MTESDDKDCCLYIQLLILETGFLGVCTYYRRRHVGYVKHIFLKLNVNPTQHIRKYLNYFEPFYVQNTFIYIKPMTFLIDV